MKAFHVRQGDLLITAIESLPKGLKTVSDSVILWGESTGHAHRLVGGRVYKNPEGSLFLNLLKTGQVVHDEHGTIKLPAGKYAVVRQREYSNKDAVKLVVD